MIAEGRSRFAMLVAPREIELREEPVPAPVPGGVVVRIRAALTDGTDLKTYRRGHPKMPMPTRFGHEFSGEIAAIGEGASAFALGDAVMCAHSAPCGTCFWCQNGQEELCETVMPTMILGAYADYIGVPPRIVERNCFKMPAAVPFTEGAFLEPLACVVHSLATLEHEPAAAIAILGNGAFGLLHALLLKREGREPVIFGRRPERVALAHELGLDSVDTRLTPIDEALAERTDGRGADIAIECTGAPEMWESAPGFVRRGGRVSFFAGLPSDARVSFLASRLHYDEVRMTAPFHFRPTDVRRAFELIGERGLPLTKLISHVYPLGDLGSAFATLDGGAGIKALIEP